MKQRIQKLLGGAGVASRRNIEQMILKGRIAVNGKIVTNLPVLVNPETDRIEVDGETIKLKSDNAGPRIYILLNKPKGVYCTNVAQGEQLRAVDLLPPKLPGRVYPVGRLDAQARGLLLMTNDGELTNQLTHPKYGVRKTYLATVDGFISDEKLRKLETSIWRADARAGGNQIRIAHRAPEATVLEITLREDRNRQVRPILAFAGHKVRDLMRTAMGPLNLKGLSSGESRLLTRKEIEQLKRKTPTSLVKRADTKRIDNGHGRQRTNDSRKRPHPGAGSFKKR